MFLTCRPPPALLNGGSSVFGGVFIITLKSVGQIGYRIKSCVEIEIQSNRVQRGRELFSVEFKWVSCSWPQSTSSTAEPLMVDGIMGKLV